MPPKQCDASGSSGLFNVDVHYYDDCGDEWFPPLSQVHYSIDSSTIPSISVSESGKNSIYLGESVDYTLTVSSHGGNCPSSLLNNIIVDSYPEIFEVVNAADGTVNESNHTIIWNNQNLNDITPWSRIITLKARKIDNCGCGNVFYNNFSANTNTLIDCCGCPLNDSTSLPIIVECFNDTVMSSSNKTAEPIPQENCRLINYTNTYKVIDNVSPISWADISFTEHGNNGQVFPPPYYGNTGPATFKLNGVDVVPSVPNIILGVSKNLGFLGTYVNNGDTLEINYTLSQPNTGSFADWSSLCVNGYNSGCSEVGCFQEAVQVTVNQADYNIRILGVPSLVSSCQSFNLILNLTKNSPNDDPKWIAHDMNITYDDSNYRYIGKTKISDIVNQSGTVLDFEPRRIGNNLTWALGKNVSRGGNITFQVELRCPAKKNAFAALNYTDNCGELLKRSATSSPSQLTFGNIYIEKTPEVIYALDRKASWKIYVTNTGTGMANNLTVVDNLESALNYIESKIRRCPTCPLAEEYSNTSLIDNKPCGPDRVTWRIGNISPKQQVMIEVNATLCGCQNRKNYGTCSIELSICPNDNYK
jgi:hypothetical protein